MKRHLTSGAILAVLLFVSGCVSVPLDIPKEPSVAIADTSNTREARNVADWLGGRTDVNGFYPLTQGFDAFGARQRCFGGPIR